MKRKILPVLIVFLSIFSGFSQSEGELRKFLNPDISLMELSRMKPAELDRLIAESKYIAVDGSISSLRDIERSDSDLIIDLNLVNGRWIGLEKVEYYTCIVNVSGIEWASRFPARTPRVLTDDLVQQNDRVLVIGKVTSYVMDQSELKAVIDAVSIRKIQ